MDGEKSRLYVVKEWNYRRNLVLTDTLHTMWDGFVLNASLSRRTNRTDRFRRGSGLGSLSRHICGARHRSGVHGHLSEIGTARNLRYRHSSLAAWQMAPRHQREPIA